MHVQQFLKRLLNNVESCLLQEIFEASRLKQHNANACGLLLCPQVFAFFIYCYLMFFVIFLWIEIYHPDIQV